MRMLTKVVRIMSAAALASAVFSAISQSNYVMYVPGAIAPGVLDDAVSAEWVPYMDGTWTSEFDASVGHLKYTFNLNQGDWAVSFVTNQGNVTQKGAKITGTAIRTSDSETTTNELTNGMINFDSISFTEDLKIGGQEISIQYSGPVSLTNNKELHLSRVIADFGSNDIVLIQRQPSANSGTSNAVGSVRNPDTNQ